MTKIIKLKSYVWNYIFKFTIKVSYFLKFEILIRFIEKILALYIDQSKPDLQRDLVGGMQFLDYLFPKGAKFKYEFQKKAVAICQSLCPFDFSIIKSPAELEAEKQAILDSQFPYYRADPTVYEAVKFLRLPIFKFL